MTMTNPKMKMKKIHPLVRDLYKRALVVGHDYPLGLDYVRRTWKDALRNPSNCPSCYVDAYVDACGQQQQQRFDDALTPVPYDEYTVEQERELRKAVGKGRFMIREMIGVIQLKKYRSMKQRYDDTNSNFSNYRNILQKAADDHDVGVVEDSSTSTTESPNEIFSQQQVNGSSGNNHNSRTDDLPNEFNKR